MGNYHSGIKIHKFYREELCDDYFMGQKNATYWCSGYCCGSETFRFCCKECQNSLLYREVLFCKHKVAIS
ncbi:hypothetical protein Ciccas_012642, partial [Cichlidogyrus casuarinus]